MKILQERLINIEKSFNWVRSEGFDIFASTGERFSLSFEIDHEKGKHYIQVQAAMIIADKAIWRWGCENENDTNMILTCFKEIKNIAQTYTFKEQERLGAEMLKKIIQ